MTAPLLSSRRAASVTEPPLADGRVKSGAGCRVRPVSGPSAATVGDGSGGMTATAVGVGAGVGVGVTVGMATVGAGDGAG